MATASANIIIGARYSRLLLRRLRIPVRELRGVRPEPREFDASLDLATLDGTNGFRLDGVDPLEVRLASGLQLPRAGDVNGDGFGDFIIGAPGDRC